MTEGRQRDVPRIANTITRAMYKMRGQFELTREELAKAVLIAAVNVGYSAWSSGIIEKLRTTADAVELDLTSGKTVFEQNSPGSD